MNRYNQKKFKHNQEKSRVMLAAKEQKRLALEPPPYPLARDHCLTITVTRQIGTVKTSEEYLWMHEEGQGYINQGWLYKVSTRECLGLMGQHRAFLLVSKEWPGMRAA